ncbi:MAG: hypothetical protein AMJ56_05315, partial [Anaerolineae bacterium SG8_19]
GGSGWAHLAGVRTGTGHSGPSDPANGKQNLKARLVPDEATELAILDLPPGNILLTPSTTLVSDKLYHSADYNDFELIYYAL